MSSNGSVAVDAVVPGQIQLDLHRGGVIESTYRRFNQERNAWVYRDAWSFSLNFTLDPALTAANEVWLTFDGIDTIGRVYLNELPPPRFPPPPPSVLAQCFRLLPKTLPNPRLPNFKELPGPVATCEAVCVSDRLCSGVTTLHAKPSGRCWLYHNVSAVSNGTGFSDGDWYEKITPQPEGCATPPSPPVLTGWAVKDQFLRYKFPVKKFLRSGTNQLTVQLESVAGLGPGGIHAEWTSVRKEPSNFGYDWSPITETQGIWLPCYLVGQTKLILLDMVATVHEVATTTGYGMKQPQSFEVRVVSRLNLTVASSVRYSVGGNWSSATTRVLHLPAGVSEVKDTLPAKGVELWWPAGYGGQPLYSVTVAASALASVDIASPIARTPVTAVRRVGFRSVAMDTSNISGSAPALQRHVYVVNGVRIFAQGANWVPPDSFESRATKPVLCDILGRARRASMNFLRIWGGGIYPQDAFFDCADELGLLLEQDGIFSNGVYPDDQLFLALVAEETQYQARRLASHPSLFMWSGSNELSPSSGGSWPAVFLQTFFPNLTHVDSSRPVWPACPAFPWTSGVDTNGLPNGDQFIPSSVHEPGPPNEAHQYWFGLCSTLENCAAGVNGLQPVDDAFYANTSFASEFGWIGMPSLESLAPVLGSPAEDYTMHSKAMTDRQNRITPLATSENQVIFNFGKFASRYINVSTAAAFKRIIHMSMVIQAECLSAEAEHYRRGRDTMHETAGATFWMLDDNWPAESWTSLEWGGRPKLLHYAAMRYNAPVAVSLYCTPSIQECSSIEVHVSSELLNATRGSLDLQVVHWAGKEGPTTSTPVAIKSQGSFSMSLNTANLLNASGCTAHSDCFVVARLISETGDNLLAPMAFQWLTLWRGAALLPAKLTIVSVSAALSNDGASEGALHITISSDAVAPNVMVHCGEASDFGYFDTNGLLLHPDQPVTLLYTPRAFAPAGEHTPCTKKEDFYAVAINGMSEVEP